MLNIDGSRGEGGGQLLRSSLALSLVTGQPFRIEKIRAGRKKPGLLRQHLTAVRAAAEICGARVSGDEMRSETLEFYPGSIRPGDYRFAVGTAGSATLVFQTVLPALAVASGPSKLVLSGGTHNPYAPPFDFLQRTFLPLTDRMGARVLCRLSRAGFYPAGGGRFEAEVEPAKRLQPLDLQQRGARQSLLARARVANLPLAIARRELKVVQDLLSFADDCLIAEEITGSSGPGNVLTIEVESEHITEVFTGFGQRGVPAERVAEETTRAARRYLAAGVPVGLHLADQLLVPMAMAGAGSLRTMNPTRHTHANIEIVKLFTGVEVTLDRRERDDWILEVTTP